jgi:hypothetical protein
MKGGAAPHQRRVESSTSPRSRSSSRSSNNHQNRLQALGFEEGELEMFFDMTNVTEDQLVHKYLEIAQNQPYNLNWGNETRAINANYMLGVYKRNGVEYTKHDIVEDTITSFYHEDEGRAQKNVALIKKVIALIKENILVVICLNIKSVVIMDYLYNGYSRRSNV